MGYNEAAISALFDSVQGLLDLNVRCAKASLDVVTNCLRQIPGTSPFILQVNRMVRDIESSAEKLRAARQAWGKAHMSPQAAAARVAERQPVPAHAPAPASASAPAPAPAPVQSPEAEDLGPIWLQLVEGRQGDLIARAPDGKIVIIQGLGHGGHVQAGSWARLRTVPEALRTGSGYLAEVSAEEGIPVVAPGWNEVAASAAWPVIKKQLQQGGKWLQPTVVDGEDGEDDGLEEDPHLTTPGSEALPASYQNRWDA